MNKRLLIRLFAIMALSIIFMTGLAGCASSVTLSSVESTVETQATDAANSGYHIFGIILLLLCGFPIIGGLLYTFADLSRNLLKGGCWMFLGLLMVATGIYLKSL